MFFENDSDIKIAGDKPSADIKKNAGTKEEKGISTVFIDIPTGM